MRRDLPEYRLGFLLEMPQQHFYQDFARELQAAAPQASAFRGVSVVDHWASQHPDDIAARLNRLAARTHAVAMVSPDHPTITAAVEALQGARLSGLFAAVGFRTRRPPRLYWPGQPQGRPYRRAG